MKGDYTIIENFRTLLIQPQDKCQTLNPSSDLAELMIPPKVFPYDTGNIRDWYDMDTDSVLGEGSSSTMFKCFERSTTSKHPYACKAMSKADTFNTFDKIRQEVKIMFALQHQPNIITLHDVFEDADYVYLVMELCDGGELLEDVNHREAHPARRSLSKGSTSASTLYSEAEAACIMFQIMNAIRTCHSVGVVHRDLKPENVLIVNKDENNFPRIKVIDFGLSTFIQPGEVLHDFVGTLIYTAPEVIQQVYGGHEADVWSAGCIIFILLCGYHPFHSVMYRGARELLAAQTDLENLLFRAPGHIRGFNPISCAGQDLVRKMLTVESSSRLTVDKFFEHPWVTHHMSTSQKT